MNDPALVGVPLLSWSDGEAVKLALGICELNTVAGFEITATNLR